MRPTVEELYSDVKAQGYIIYRSVPGQLYRRLVRRTFITFQIIGG